MATTAVAGTFVDNEPRMDRAHADGTVFKIPFGSAWINKAYLTSRHSRSGLTLTVSQHKTISHTSLFVMTDIPREEGEDVGHETAMDMAESILDSDRVGVRRSFILISGGSNSLVLG